MMMDRKNNTRLKSLEFILTTMSSIKLKDAANILNVSEMTLRRDLNTEGCPLVLLGGHIVRDPKNYHETNYLIFEQETKNLKEKMVAGKLAADLVENGDVIFFDCGSSIPFIASQISSEIKFTALCCSLNTFTILKEKSHCEVILAGGIYSNHNSFFTPVNNSEVESILTTKAFISAAGVSNEFGVSCFNYDEAKVKQIEMKKSRKNILVFDHTKINQVKKAYIGDLNQFDLLICDKELPKNFYAKK